MFPTKLYQQRQELKVDINNTLLNNNSNIQHLPQMMHNLSSSTHYSIGTQATPIIMNNSSSSLLSIMSSCANTESSSCLGTDCLPEPLILHTNKFDICKENVSLVFNTFNKYIEQRKELLLNQITQIESSTSIVDKIEFKYDTNAFNTLLSTILPNFGLIRFCEYETKYIPTLLSLYNNSVDMMIKINWKIIDNIFERVSKKRQSAILTGKLCSIEWMNVDTHQTYCKTFVLNMKDSINVTPNKTAHSLTQIIFQHNITVNCNGLYQISIQYYNGQRWTKKQSKYINVNINQFYCRKFHHPYICIKKFQKNARFSYDCQEYKHRYIHIFCTKRMSDNHCSRGKSNESEDEMENIVDSVIENCNIHELRFEIKNIYENDAIAFGIMPVSSIDQLHHRQMQMDQKEINFMCDFNGYGIGSGYICNRNIKWLNMNEGVGRKCPVFVKNDIIQLFFDINNVSLSMAHFSGGLMREMNIPEIVFENIVLDEYRWVIALSSPGMEVEILN